MMSSHESHSPAVLLLAVFLLPLCVVDAVNGQAPPPDGKAERSSQNMHVQSHVPLGGAFTTADIEIEQELSRPYVYVSRMLVHGFDIIELDDSGKGEQIFSWRIENAELHQGSGAMDGKYFKLNGRYYYVQGFQFRQGGPDADLGAIVFDVTGLPDVSTVREVGRIRAPDTPGGFHNVFAYKHSDGRVLLFTTVVGPHANIYDMEVFLNDGPEQGLIGRIPVPENPTPATGLSQTYHDFYIGFDPATQQDKFYAASQPVGAYIFDVSRPEAPKLITSVSGVPGVTRDHTFVPTPDGRYAVAESHLRYSPIRVYDLKPGLDGEVRTISRPVGAWTANWRTHAHNLEMRWPYVFVANYEEGLQVINLLDPTRPYTEGFFDTYDGPTEHGYGGSANPEGPNTSFFTEVANGAFSVDVRNADGLIVIGDFRTGFWSVRMDGFDGWDGRKWGMPNVSSAQDWDNGPEGVRPRQVSLRIGMGKQ